VHSQAFLSLRQANAPLLLLLLLRISAPALEKQKKKGKKIE
jgi:hypothetical protein